MTIKTTSFTHRPRVSLARFSFCWWRHNRLLMTSQWPDNCDATTWVMISTSLDIDFIHGDVHGRSCKKLSYRMAVVCSSWNGKEGQFLCCHLCWHLFLSNVLFYLLQCNMQCHLVGRCDNYLLATRRKWCCRDYLISSPNPIENYLYCVHIVCCNIRRRLVFSLRQMLEALIRLRNRVGSYDIIVWKCDKLNLLDLLECQTIA